jgi:DNA-binding MarR family transcriptional regulator
MGGLTARQLANSVAERPAPLTVLLTAAERALASQVEEGLRTAGYSDLRAAHAQVFVALHPDGSRLTDLAIHAGMTKQAMGELVRYLEHRRYLQIEPDPRDRRAKIIRLTGPGWRAHEVCLALAEAGERLLVERLGEGGVRELRNQLRRIVEGAGGRQTFRMP